MKIWLLTIGEPVPIGAGSQDRLHRTGSFGRYLASRGHNVVWWTSTFDHFRKEHLMPDDAVVSEACGLQIRLLRGCGYQRNISVSRFVDHAQVARRFAALSKEERRPDIVVSALPTVDLCLAATVYGANVEVPVVIDLRDMWPDIIADSVPRPCRPLARTLLTPLFNQARRVCSTATALIGITDAFVDWGLRRGVRSRSDLDRAFPFTYDTEPANAADVHSAEAFWDAHGVCANGPELVVCYFGNVGKQLDLSHVIAAARQLSASGKPVRFVLCGEGERLEEYRRLSEGLPNVLFPGWVNRAQILALMQRSSVGLDPLTERYDYLATINNKAIEYLSGGLPVVSSPRHGVLCELLQRSECGVSYRSNDADSLVECLSRLTADRGCLKVMGANALSVFRQEFSASVVFPAMENHLAVVREQYRHKRAIGSSEPAQVVNS